MKNGIKSLLVEYLPKSLVKIIRELRKKKRLRSRFMINKGKNIEYFVDSLHTKFSIFINPFLNGGVDDDIYRTGEWEPEIGQIIKKYLVEGDCFLDIGANIGYHSLFAANIVGESGRVVAFEPIPRIYKQFMDSIELNNFKNIKVFNIALSDKVGNAHLSLVDENIGASSLKEVSSQREVGSKILINLDLLDSYQDELSGLKLVKIDVEGNEYEVIKGGFELLRKLSPVVILEFSAHLYESDYAGKSLDLYNSLLSLGYRITTVTGIELDIEDLLRLKDYDLLHTNLLCIPEYLN